MGWAGIRYELGQALLLEYDAKGILKAQPDGMGREPRIASYEVLHPLGFAARAPAVRTGPDGKPLEGGGCKLRIGHDGTDIQVELLGDARDLAGIPPLALEGGSVQYAPGAAAPSFDKHDSEDGTKQIYVEVGSSAHLVTIGKDGAGKSIIELVHADGMSLQMLEHAVVLKNAAGDVYLELNAEGGALNGNWKVTGALDVGATSVQLVKAPPLVPLLAALTALSQALAQEKTLGPTIAAAQALQTAIVAFGVAAPTTLTKGT